MSGMMFPNMVTGEVFTVAADTLSSIYIARHLSSIYQASRIVPGVPVALHGRIVYHYNVPDLYKFIDGRNTHARWRNTPGSVFCLFPGSAYCLYEIGFGDGLAAREVSRSDLGVDLDTRIWRQEVFGNVVSLEDRDA